MIIYRYERPGESYDRIPAHDLTEAEHRQVVTGRSKDELTVIARLYTRAEVADPAPASDPEPLAAAIEHAAEEDTDDGDTNRV